MDRETERLNQNKEQALPVPPWEKWGPYVAERGWGSVREDYSADGDAWSFFTHDNARFRAYRWAEDGIAGISDRYQVLLFAFAFWNGNDPILKERLFGLNMWEGNHGEDVKEYYYYLDALPSHSYLKYLYKYPQREFPYETLVNENSNRDVREREYELIDTDIFNENRYFDIFIEYAKADTEDICIRLEAINRGPETARLDILPHLWFRNQWSWGEKEEIEPSISLKKGDELCLIADDSQMKPPPYLIFDYHLGKRFLYCSPQGKALFTNNETNKEALWDVSNDTPYVKDAFHRYLIHNDASSVNPKNTGTKSCIQYSMQIPSNQSVILKFRLTDQVVHNALEKVDQIIAERKQESDRFFEGIHPKKASAQEKALQRQALSGMIWNKQFYYFDVNLWLQGDNPKLPPPESHKYIRNVHWRHIASMRIFSMPDKWEYPWFAAWDLSFHTLALAMVDLEFAKLQLWLLLFDQFQHPNGEVPAYEWEFSEVHPPLQAWAALKIFEYEKKKYGKEDFAFLEKCFHKLLLNFSWWINKVDKQGNNVFEGGFLGMDNVGFMDRSQKLPEGFALDQADGAGWISLLCLNLMRIALTLSKKNPTYEGLGIKFFQHFIYVSAAMRKGSFRPYDMWNDEEGFFDSYLRFPNGEARAIHVRSLVGIIPFFACDVWDEEELKSFPEFYISYQWIYKNWSDLVDKCIQSIPHDSGNHHLLGLLNTHEIQRFLSKIWDPNEFRSEFGMRSLSKYHEKNPATWSKYTIKYEPAEAQEKIKGGNSNWRGPIWFPLNYLMIDTLKRLSKVYKENLRIQVENEPEVTVGHMAESFAQRLIKLFLKNEKGHRPIYGEFEKMQQDPHFEDHILFYEQFHGDNGRGLGASHQTGWTGLIANLIEEMYEE